MARARQYVSISVPNTLNEVDVSQRRSNTSFTMLLSLLMTTNSPTRCTGYLLTQHLKSWRYNSTFFHEEVNVPAHFDHTVT